MKEFKYKGKRFRQPFRFFFSLIYTCVCFLRSLQIDRSSFKAPLKIVSAVCVLFLTISTVAYTIVPDPVQAADDDEVIKNVMKLEGKSFNNPADLKEQVLIQKSNSQNVPVEKVDKKKSVVAVTYPAPVAVPTVNNVSFKAKIVTPTPKADTAKADKKKTVTAAATTEPQKQVSTKPVTTSTTIPAVKAKANDSKEKSEASATPVTSSKPEETSLPIATVETTAKPTETPEVSNQDNSTETNTDDNQTSDTGDDQQAQKTDTEVASNELEDLDVTDDNVSIVPDTPATDDGQQQAQTVDTAANQKPILVVKDEVTINKDANFNPDSVIITAVTAKNSLPALQFDSNVNVKKDGDYTITVKAVDQAGNSTEQSTTVHVVTHPEQAAEEQRIAEEKAAKAAAEKKKAEEDEIRKAGGLLSTEKTNRKTGSPNNPYPGWNYNNCTWAAWQLAYDHLGIALPHWGDAYTWLSFAQRDGYATGTIPKKDSIQVSGGGGMGHVSYVTKVSPDGKSVYIQQGSLYSNTSNVAFSGGYSEMWQNAYGALISGKPILGYIYLR